MFADVGGLVVGTMVGFEVVGLVVIGGVVGDPVGDSVTHCDRAQEEPRVDWPGGMMQVGRETVRADPQLRQKALSLGCRGCTVGIGRERGEPSRKLSHPQSTHTRVKDRYA